MTQRSIHGGHEFHFEGNLLVARSWGSWNLEAIRTYANEWKQEALKRNFSHWGSFVDGREWELATPEALSEIFDLSYWLYEHGYRFNGNVVSSSVASTIIQNEQSKRMPELKVKSITNFQECLDWCKVQAKGSPNLGESTLKR